MASQKKLTKEIALQVSRFAKQLQLSKIPVNHLIVFGSQAKGDAKPWSDIDICVISDTFGKDRHRERVTLMKLTDEKTIDIEPHPYHPRDFADKWDPLAHEIKKYGIVIK
ncbi:MAG: polymerase, beta domain protein region protein [Candidatus Gottesmanbacteria bacterium GW2011_GWA1_43_11]|uniref:Polymerase, beta domain protein region protein n=1 Tax=Candidatus Gottesmanbacteria bacterium GW2011_GWA1_43_11 TaxID=1618436 RepID=A0A0G1CBN6_9BACT|nr:MAG: polymerase, beta domain protein region protein [Candidatus Gottesmanbacteria bacterium GW2011_GWA1_43_11]